MSYPQTTGHRDDRSDQKPSRPALVPPTAIATELWLVVVLGQAVAYGGHYSTAADTIRDAARGRGNADEVALMTSTGFIVTLIVVSGAILAAVSLTLVWCARSGYGWARLVLAFLSAYLVVQAVFALFDGVGPLWTTVPEVISGVAALGAVALLLRRESDAYCKDMARYRRSRTGRSPNGGTPHPNPRFSEHFPAQTPTPPQPPVPYRPQSPPDGSGYYDPYAHRPPGYGPYPPYQAGSPPTYPRPTPDDRPDALPPQVDSGRPASGSNVHERDLGAGRSSEESVAHHDPDGSDPVRRDLGPSQDAGSSQDTDADDAPGTR